MKLRTLLMFAVASMGVWQGVWAQGTADNPISVNLLEPGSLGTEVLMHVDNIQDVEYLSVSGDMNADDWGIIALMDNAINIDLGNATTSASIPAIHFEGKCTKLQTLILPQGLVEIGNFAFHHTNIVSITFPSSLRKIGQGAFEYAAKLQTLNLPDDISYIGSQAFYSCTKLTTVNYSKNYASVPNSCFAFCTSLTTCNLPKGLKTIGSAAFSRCTQLNTRIPSTVNNIGYDAFRECAIDSVFIPEGCNLGLRSTSYDDNTRIPGTFDGCSSLVYIEFPTTYYNAVSPIQYCGNLQTIVFKSPTVLENEKCKSTFLKGITNSNLTIRVPSFAVSSYKLDDYWYSYNIEGFATSDVKEWSIHQPLTMNNIRFEGTPDIIIYSGYLKLNGDAPMNVGYFYTRTNVDKMDSETGMILSNCENIVITGDYKHGYSTVGKKWYFVSLPFDTKVGDITNSSNAKFAIRYYDGANRAANGAGGSWKNYGENDIIPAGTGFIYQTNTDCRSYFISQNNATKSNAISRKEFVKVLAANDSETAADRGWNLVGNPWQSYYNIHKLNFTAPITTWNGSTYVAYSIIDDDYAIKPNEAFFVQCPDEVTEISFPTDGRQLTSTIESQNGARQMESASAKRQLIDIEIRGGEASDKTRIVLNEEAAMAYETGRDASKFLSMEGSVPQIYSVDEEDNEYAINERPMGNGTVKLRVSVQQAGRYTLSATRNDMEQAVLKDLLTGAEVDLTQSGYDVELEAGTYAGRFVLVLAGKAVTSVKGAATETQPAEKVFYNLNGQRIATPQKGLYIVNGKKVLK